MFCWIIGTHGLTLLTDKSYMEPLSIPVSGILRLLGFFIKPIRLRKRTSQLRGYYLIYHQNSSIPIINSPDGTPNFLYIKVNYWFPDVLKITSKDFDARYRRIWKTWEGKITMLDEKHGRGYYTYLETNEPGEHEIWCLEAGTISVRIVDKGKADLSQRKDNDPANQQWKKIQEDNALIVSLKEFLKSEISHYNS
jgi:hypothetical protein